MGYLPEGYEVPKSTGNYMRFNVGANKFRILSEPLIGWEYWTESKKPVRAKERWNVIPVDADISKGWEPKHFWAFIVWNFDAKRIQILEITQKSILERLQSLINNEDWGDPRNYSITVTRTGEGLTTKYEVDASPHKPTPPEILQQYEESDIKLESLMEGANPFPNEVKTEEIDPDDIPFD